MNMKKIEFINTVIMIKKHLQISFIDRDHILK